VIPLASLVEFLGEAGGWAVVVLGFGMLIFIHEAGHFLAARWSGVRVEAFSLGFGPVLWGFRRGPTHYRIS
jgi:regulator of sigma E protease